MTKNKETVCAIVVTYNRKELLLECLKALRKQTRPIDAIYLIDNASSDGTPKILFDNGYISELPPNNLKEPWEKEFKIKNLANGAIINLHYVRMSRNTGGAGGFYEGVKRAYEKGYDWLWLMDDDAEPEKDALEKLDEYFDQRDISALSSIVKDTNGKINIYHRGFIKFNKIFPGFQNPLPVEKYLSPYVEIDFSSFVGIIINKETIKKFGFPRKEFFIYGDDAEYCIRLRQFGKILLVTNSIIVHKDKTSEIINTKKFLGRVFLRVSYDKLWLTYFGTRNLIWLGRRYTTNKMLFYGRMFRNYIMSIAGILLFDDHKIKRIKFLTNSYLDGLRGNFDNEKPKEILYG